MKTEQIDVKKIKVNPSNPRIIKDDKYHKLVKSIQEFPQMLEIRPIVVNDEMIIIGGNMRYRAAIEAGFKKIPVMKVSNLTEEQQKEFIVKDNVAFGDWDFDLLANEWDSDLLKDWGINIPEIPTQLDYSIIDDDEDTDSDVESKSTDVKKAILIDFEQEHYDEALALIKFWREQKLYIGGFLLEKLKQEKDKI